MLDSRVLNALVKRFFEDRILLMYKDGKSVREIHDRLIPMGMVGRYPVPIPMNSFIHKTIAAAIAHGRVEKVLK